MKLSTSTKSIILNCISLLYVVLFVYAAVSKLLDFENFQVQLAQSPLLSAFAGWISFIVPIIEIVIAFFICFERSRLYAFYCAFSLMVLFSAYIIIIINFSPFVPCSCGGILEKMTWNQHLVFNLLFVLLGFCAILFQPHQGNQQTNFKISVALIILGCSVGIMILLFLTSEDMIHHRNNFIRRFPHHPANLTSVLDLKFNSFYIAGEGNGKIYLGNKTAPLTVTVVDSSLKFSNRYVIKIISEKLEYHSLRLTVRPPYFYIADGSIPIVFRGLIRNWVADVWTEGAAYFNAFEPINANKAAFRAISSNERQHVLGILTVNDTSTVFLKPLLDKQIDGIFDTGGTLNYNLKHQKLLYTYTYKNEYIITDTGLKTKIVNHTIDTISHVRIKVNYVPSIKGTKLASPAWIVNNLARTNGDYLFINSALIGRFEPEDLWDEASIIDVYDITSNTYSFSFYIYNTKEFKMSDFIITNDRGYALAGQYLTSYKLRHDFYKTKNKADDFSARKAYRAVSGEGRKPVIE
ncbi:hypothetical protein MW871_06025 [Flavobacterium sp. I-SCBP12n]|uniref:Methylamine utilisation protein MauE domain-containing protein n=1 Tax=Flavobacterium pygoscelis TaxID=2893176 RepID=A0A9X1XX87_9FLAO|nr:MauE/DoxX family redox-associated membrane protein [Flavobacterium pygoscelis]MCK8141447.1 hypothetical protein [Flavobacterium pygoscelis]